MLKPSLKEQIIAETQRLFLENFRQSPHNVTVNLDERCVMIHLQGHTGPDIKALVEQNDNDAMRTTRELIVEYICPDLIHFIQENTDIVIDSLYYDWDDSNLSGLITGLTSNSRYRDNEDYYYKKDEVHHRVGKITYDVQKMPDSIYSFWIGEDNLVVVREGLLIKLEEELVKLGFEGTFAKQNEHLKNPFS